MRSVDVVVVGGGPAGATAATLLKKRSPDRSIVLCEQATFPRHHVGESTLPDANGILAKLGVLAEIDGAGFVRKTGITYRWRVDQPIFSEVFARGVLEALAGGARIPDHSWQVDRSRYDHILLEHARRCGVEVWSPARVEAVLRDDDRVTGVRVSAGDQPLVDLRAGHVVDCTGQARLLSRALGLAKQTHPLGDLAVYRYYRGMRWSAPLVGSLAESRIFFSATPAGWMWFIPLSATDVSVGLVTRREFLEETEVDRLFDAELATVPDMVAMLEGAVQCGAPGAADDAPRTRTIADWSYSHARPCGPGYYLAGDAAAFVDPILSSGILLAHNSGLMVANAIATEWYHPDVPVDELHDGYAQFYGDLYGGFLVMASWWYSRRKVEGIDEWLASAARLGGSARGAAELATDDIQSFMTFAAGYLADFRFVNIGIAFGDEGLAQCIDGLENRPGAAAPLLRRMPDRGVRLRSEATRASVEPYLATDVDSDRWWKLPAIRLSGSFGERVYRPPIRRDARDDDAIVRSLRVVDRLAAACDGRRTLDQAVRAVVASQPPEHRASTHAFADAVTQDLIALGVLVPTA
jgi:clorobiocin biosynthesis protein Clo-hal